MILHVITNAKEFPSAWNGKPMRGQYPVAEQEAQTIADTGKEVYYLTPIRTAYTLKEQVQDAPQST